MPAGANFFSAGLADEDMASACVGVADGIFFIRVDFGDAGQDAVGERNLPILSFTYKYSST